jgi:hypothetical protein
METPMRVRAGDEQTWACVMDENLNIEPMAEPVATIAAREWRPGLIWNDIATTLPFASPAEAEAAGARLLADLIATIDTRGLKRWTNVFECDDCEVTKVAVNDPYSTCALVICGDCNGGVAVAGPIDEPYCADEDDIAAYGAMTSEEHHAYDDEPDEPTPFDEWTPEEEARFQRKWQAPLARFRRWVNGWLRIWGWQPF